MTTVILGAPGPVFLDPNEQAVHSNATITANGSAVFSGYGIQDVNLFVNVKASPTGTTPTITYTIQEVDPGDNTTVIGPTSSTSAINAIGIQKISLSGVSGGTIKVSWTVTGTTPSFTQVYTTLAATLGPGGATYQPMYGSSNQTLTVTLASLANAGARASTAVDNTASLYEDVLFFVKTTSAAAATSATGYVNIYGYGTVDGGTTYPEGITGTDAAATLSAPPNLVLLAQITVNANAKTYAAGPFSFCRMYGLDRLPAKWGLVFVNQSGATLNATAGNHAITYQGVNGKSS